MAVGDTLALWGPAASAPPASGFATLDVRNGHLVLDFDAGTDESAHFGGALPAHYGGGDLEVEILWAATSATSGNVTWQVAVENTATIDIDTDSFGAAASVTTSAAGTSGALARSTVTVSAANAGNPQAGDVIRLRVTRDADNAADTMAGDAELVAVQLYEA